MILGCDFVNELTERELITVFYNQAKGLIATWQRINLHLN